MKPKINIEEYFDLDRPTVTEIRQRYKGNFIDLNEVLYDKGKLTNEDVGRAILQAVRENRGLIIPEEYNFWNPNDVCRRIYMKKDLGIDSIKVNSPLRFKRFGPKINIIPRLSKEEIKKKKITPRNAFKKTFNDPDVKRRLLETPHRGWGYCDDVGSQRVVPFDAVFEGHLFREYCSDRLHIKYQFADSLIEIPSRSGEHPYRTKFSVLSVTEAGNEYYVEWLKMVFEHVCKDTAFRSMSTKMRGDDILKKAYKYARPELQFDAHVYAALEEIEDYSETSDDMLSVKVKFPRARKVSPFHALSTATIIGTKNKARRPIKAEITIGLGYVMGLEEIKAEQLYDLDE